MRHFFFSNVSPPRRPPETVANAVASRSLRPCDGHLRLPHKDRAGLADLVAMRSVRFARGLRPSCSFLGRAERTHQQGRKKASPALPLSLSNPQKTPFPPPAPNDVSSGETQKCLTQDWLGSPRLLPSLLLRTLSLSWNLHLLQLTPTVRAFKMGL